MTYCAGGSSGRTSGTSSSTVGSVVPPRARRWVACPCPSSRLVTMARATHECQKEDTMNEPLQVTLAQLQELRDEVEYPRAFKEAIRFLGERAQPDTAMDIGHFIHMQVELFWILERFHPNVLRSWAMDCAEQAFMEARRVWWLWDQPTGYRSTVGPTKFIESGAALISLVRRGYLQSIRDAIDGPYYSEHVVTALSETNKKTSTPFLHAANALAIAVYQYRSQNIPHWGWCFKTTGVTVIPPHDIEYLIAEVGLAAGAAVTAEMIGPIRWKSCSRTRQLERSGEMRKIEEAAGQAAEQRKTWCRDRMMAYLTGEVVAVAPSDKRAPVVSTHWPKVDLFEGI